MNTSEIPATVRPFKMTVHATCETESFELGTITVTAGSEKEAAKAALDLWDERLTAASCSPSISFERIEE